MTATELMQRALKNTSIAELLAIINNEELVLNDSLEERSRIRFIRKHIKQIKKLITEREI
jgi:beta-glucosidase/6-phospho-beta-glucosidase/beta-galactosidase